jgi:hypothetical protein
MPLYIGKDPHQSLLLDEDLVFQTRPLIFARELTPKF